MEEGYNLFDYNINMNDIIQLMEKPDLAELDKKPETDVRNLCFFFTIYNITIVYSIFIHFSMCNFEQMFLFVIYTLYVKYFL